MIVVGHERVRTQLEQGLPSVALLRGSESVGKWTLAEYLCEYHKIKEIDIKRVPKLTVDEVKEIRRFSSTSPFGKLKVVIIRLDGSEYSPLREANPAALNAMLKLLEEPPKTVKFILTSSKPTLVTIESRAHLYRCGLLSKDEIIEVLTRFMDMSPREADIAATLSYGTIDSALEVKYIETAKAKVLSVLKALADRDLDLLLQSTRGTTADGQPAWGASEHRLLYRWIQEALSQRWSVFSEAEGFGLVADKDRLRVMLLQLSKVSKARPKLAVRAALEPMLARK